jgi:hypothetical protein
MCRHEFHRSRGINERHPGIIDAEADEKLGEG